MQDFFNGYYRVLPEVTYPVSRGYLKLIKRFGAELNTFQQSLAASSIDYSRISLKENRHGVAKLIFDLTASEQGTILNFTREGLVPGKKCYSRCHDGWHIIIKDYLFHFIHRRTATFRVVTVN